MKFVAFLLRAKLKTYATGGEEEFRYHNESEGELKQFSGRETIFLQGRQVYVLTYQGGRLR